MEVNYNLKKIHKVKKYSRKCGKIILMKIENKNKFFSFCIEEKETKRKKEKRKKEN